MTHQKPTQEELDANIQKAQEALDKIETQPSTPPVDPQPSTPVPSTPEPSKPAEPSTPDPSKPESSKPEPSEPETPEPSKPAVDYRQKYVDSTREAQRLYKNNIAVNKAIADAEELQPPTDEEMQALYPEWDTLDKVMQDMARDNLLNKKKFQLLSDASKVTKNMQEWNSKVDAYVNDPQTLIDHPELEGKQDDFKIYASGKEGIGTHFDVLMSAFLHDVLDKRPKNKGTMLNRGSGGPNDPPKPKSNKISLEEARQYMKADYKKYKEMLQNDMIDMSEI